MNGKAKKYQDFIAISIFIIAFFLVFCILTRGKYLYGSSMDWESQHYLIPEYFRNQFYQTGKLFPDFAFHLGAGQNIYYFSYYGLMSPLILFSYLLPFVPMVDYIQGLGILIPIVSTILFYFYLKKHTDSYVAFVAAFLFLCAGPVIFHSHRHIMFINYLPFLMMALFGIDAFFQKGKISLLTNSLFLIIMTSYYYSVGSLVALFCYGIYHLLREEKFDYRKFMKFLIPFVVAILASMVILLPTLYALLNGRGESQNSITLQMLLTPKFNFRFMVHQTYGIGLTMISVISLIHLLLTKKKENIFLGILLLLISIFPIFNYILNGTLYIDSKSLIPFLPIVLLVTAKFLEDLFKNKVSSKELVFIIFVLCLFTRSKTVYLDLGITAILFAVYKLTGKKQFFTYPFLFLVFSICVAINLNDKLEEKKKIMSPAYQEITPLINKITEREDNLYRINNDITSAITMNKIVNQKHFTSNLYSSTFHQAYNYFFFDVANNHIPHRNKSMTPSSHHPVFQWLMGEKYYLTTETPPLASSKIFEENGVQVYELEHVLPIGYATPNTISLNSYKEASYPANLLALVGNAVVSNGEGQSQNFPKSNLDFTVLHKKNIRYTKTENGYHVEADKKASMKIRLEEDTTSKLVFIRMKNEYNPACGVEELAITINGVKNKLSCTTWKYHNQNFVFDYVFYDTNEFNLTFSKGTYELSNLEIYTIPYQPYFDKIDAVDTFQFDEDMKSSDSIYGSIDVSKDGYFVLSIPYDAGFEAYMDGKKMNIEKVNDVFMGFPIQNGKHHITFHYHAPYKRMGLILSSIGVVLLIGIFFYERKKGNVR